MDILNTFKISGSALQAQSTRLNTISSNLANIETTSTPEGGPYKKKSVYFQSKPLSFQEQLETNIQTGLQGVAVTKITEDSAPPYFPTGVRIASQIYTSCIVLVFM